jgi:hypothetical protein
MSWAKLDDRFWMHPKVTAIGNEGAGTFARLLSYCSCYLTDGLVPADAVKMISQNRKLLEHMNDLGVIELRESRLGPDSRLPRLQPDQGRSRTSARPPRSG